MRATSTYGETPSMDETTHERELVPQNCGSSRPSAAGLIQRPQKQELGGQAMQGTYTHSG